MRRKESAGSVPKRILVVDDDPDISKLLVRWLLDGGYEPVGVLGAVEGIKIEGDFAALLLDLNLPNGTVEQIAAAHPGVPVITMSGMPQAQLRKPFSRDDLVQALQFSIGGAK